MNPELTLQRADPGGADGPVRDFDELDHAAQAEFPALAAGETTYVTREVAAGFRDGELVRFGEYYRVSVGE